MANKNFEVKHGLSVGGTERISSAGVGTFTDLNVTGTTTTLDTTTLQVQDKNIVLNYGTGDTSGTAGGAGITIQDAVDASNDATILWNASNDDFDFSHPISATLNTAAQPNITSTGTLNALGIAGNLTVDTDTLHVDASNSRVGIGTASPGGLPLQTKVSSGDNKFRQTTASKDAFTLGLDDSTGDTIIGTHTTYPHTTFKDNGNVGIGTANPLKKLHIQGGGYDQIMINSAAGNNTNRLSGIAGIDYTGNQFSILQNFAQSGSQITYYGSADGSFRGVQGHSFNVNASSTATTNHHEAIKINSDGYVTISRNASEYGLELRSTGTRSGLVLATPNSGNTIKGSLLLLTDDTLRLGTQSVYNIHMNQSGQNTMPNQPYIRCYGNYGGLATNQGTATEPFNNWTVAVNRGITHSNGTFTVPIAGEYLITYSFYFWVNNSGPGVSHAVVLKVGSSSVQEAIYETGSSSHSYYDNTKSNSIIMNLSAGDTFHWYAYADIYAGVTHTNMSAYLLG